MNYKITYTIRDSENEYRQDYYLYTSEKLDDKTVVASIISDYVSTDHLAELADEIATNITESYKESGGFEIPGDYRVVSDIRIYIVNQPENLTSIITES